ncbi:MAG: YfcE family phosphodiesterase, partial [Bacteroidales bacterium]|nr:YfcE family phosphodiesterase [Bacteroidales bacterium]
KKLFPVLMKEKPQLVIAGHPHILQVKYDKTYNFLFINPGAAGNSGIHKVKTACRFTIDGKQIKDLEILELTRG